MPNELSAEKLEQRAKNVLLHQLSRSMKTKQQLQQILQRREIPDEIAQAVLNRFEEAQLIDDVAFARAFVSSRLAAGGKSRSALARELRQKGVSDSRIEHALADLQAEDELQMATTLAKKRAERMQSLDRDVRYRRLSGFLARRGFSASVIGSALRQIS
ncbi:MAG: hypothetical protein RL418_197 [Actinomycetota bacterium]|jgi:regulatory protein